MKTIEINRECPSCNGYGLYKGMSERDGFAVVCHHCKGKGWNVFKLEYNDPPDERKRMDNVDTVIEVNPGIVCGDSEKLPSFGGIPYMDWVLGKPFPPGSEMRNYTCPAWWFQSANYDKKPKWEECYSSWGGTFSDCKYFPGKDLCWEKWTEENK